MQSENECTDDENVFFFESDHLALRGNSDYSSVLKTIIMLQAQKLRVHKHIEELHASMQEYLEDPELLVKKIKENEPIVKPYYITLVDLPEISSKYDLELPINTTIKTESEADNEVPKVRGRIYDESKPKTFNRLWTNEEQRRLEELLNKYPPEEFESRRFTKIAKALGNRTTQQVSSRVQKYFQKLHEAGLPVPGRLPKNRHKMSKQKFFYKPSTFFPAHNVSVSMPEEDDYGFDDFAQNLHLPANIKQESDSTAAATFETESVENNEDEKVTEGVRAFEEYEMKAEKALFLKMIEAIHDEKVKYQEGYNPDPMAAKCEDCDEDTVSRTRWRCNSCYCYLNLCLDCLTDQLVKRRFEHIAHDVVAEEDEQ